jgi:hypothetical protein
MNECRHRKCRIRDCIAVLFILLAVTGLSSCEDILSDSVDPRNKLTGTWKVDETAGTLKTALEIYRVEISKHPYDSNRIVIYNFYNVDADAEAVLSGRTLALPRQTLQGGFDVSGSGQITGSNANEITWSYTVDDGSSIPVSRIAVYTFVSL